MLIYVAIQRVHMLIGATDAAPVNRWIVMITDK